MSIRSSSIMSDLLDQKEELSEKCDQLLRRALIAEEKSRQKDDELIDVRQTSKDLALMFFSH
jgi:hypothetical protein